METKKKSKYRCEITMESPYKICLKSSINSCCSCSSPPGFNGSKLKVCSYTCIFPSTRIWTASSSCPKCNISSFLCGTNHFVSKHQSCISIRQNNNVLWGLITKIKRRSNIHYSGNTWHIWNNIVLISINIHFELHSSTFKTSIETSKSSPIWMSCNNSH